MQMQAWKACSTLAFAAPTCGITGSEKSIRMIAPLLARVHESDRF